MTKTKKTDMQGELKESAHKIWLAGLGALSAAEEEGSKLFKNLVKKGEGFEKRGKKQFDDAQGRVEEKVEVAKDKAGAAFGKLGRGFDGKVADTLNRLGVPSRMEIQKLTRRVETLTKKVDGLTQKPTTRPGKVAKAAKTAKKTATRTRKSA